jgi:hypothetical protein
VILLTASIFSSLPVSLGSAFGPDAYLVYDPANGTLSYDADAAGGVAPARFAVLGTTQHRASLGADFLLVA